MKHPTPWSYMPGALYDSRYYRKSEAIVDAHGDPVIFLDPSEGEYAGAIDPATARRIVACANVCARLEINVLETPARVRVCDMGESPGNVVDDMSLVDPFKKE